MDDICFGQNIGGKSNLTKQVDRVCSVWNEAGTAVQHLSACKYLPDQDRLIGNITDDLEAETQEFSITAY